SDASGSSKFRPDAQGRVVLTCLVPATEFTIRLLGTAGAVLHEEQIPGLGPEEKRTVELVLASTGRSLHGRIVDGQGSPIFGAQVELVDGIWSTFSSSNSTGEFHVEGLFAKQYALTVSKVGFATSYDAAFEIPATELPVVFRLEAGHEVRVHV